MKVDCVGAYNHPKVISEHKVDFNSIKELIENDGVYEVDPTTRSTLDILGDRVRASISCANTESAPSFDVRYADSIDDLSERIRNFRKLGNASYSGECLMHRPGFLPVLRRTDNPEKRIDTIIDLIEKPGLKEKCKENRLNYYVYNMDWGYGNQPIFVDENSLVTEYTKGLSKKGLTVKEAREKVKLYKAQIAGEKTAEIRQLKNLIDEVNRGHFYMACEYGEYRTVNCLALVSTFNPNWRGERIPPNAEFFEKFKNLFNNLTPEHKKILGLSESFCENIAEYIKELGTKFNPKTLVHIAR